MTSSRSARAGSCAPALTKWTSTGVADRASLPWKLMPEPPTASSSLYRSRHVPDRIDVSFVFPSLLQRRMLVGVLVIGGNPHAVGALELARNQTGGVVSVLVLVVHLVVETFILIVRRCRGRRGRLILRGPIRRLALGACRGSPRVQGLDPHDHVVVAERH